LDAQNTRMKDFFDLDILLGADDLDVDLLPDAIHSTFQRRGSELPDQIPTGLSESFIRDKQAMWKAFLKKNGLDKGPDDFAAVVSRIRKSWNGSGLAERSPEHAAGSRL
jgi:hypothetical protein